MAAEHGHLPVVQHICSLLDKKNPKDSYDYTPLHLAASFGRIEIVKFLLPFTSDKNPKSGYLWSRRTPLHNAALNGYLQIVKLLLEYTKGDINPPKRDGWTVLHCAANKGHLNVVKFYTKKLPNPNPGVTFDMFQLDYPGQLSSHERIGRTPLHFAAEFGHLVIVKHICNLLADKNPKDANDFTPLHSAAHGGQVEVVKYLVQHVGDMLPRNGVYWGEKTPLDIAVQKGHSRVIDFYKNLLGQDVINELNIYSTTSFYGKGRTVFHAAAAKGHLQLLKLLGKKAEDKNPRDEYLHKTSIKSQSREKFN